MPKRTRLQKITIIFQILQREKLKLVEKGKDVHLLWRITWYTNTSSPD
jgi:hypothetical protein